MVQVELEGGPVPAVVEAWVYLLQDEGTLACIRAAPANEVSEVKPLGDWRSFLDGQRPGRD